jgi:hypothetical protein
MRVAPFRRHVGVTRVKPPAALPETWPETRRDVRLLAPAAGRRGVAAKAA